MPAMGLSMMHLLIPLLSLLLCTTALAQDSAPRPAQKAEVIKAGDWTITATQTEGWAVNGRTRERVELYKQMEEAERKKCEDYSFSARILSVVGSFVSYYLSEGGYCGGAHPFEVRTFMTIDLARGGHTVALSELFDRHELEDALNKDPWLSKARAEQDGCTYSESDLTGHHFAFHHLKDDKVAVRLGLPHGCEVMRGSFTELGLYLTPPEWLRKQLVAADKARLLLGQRGARTRP
jgi:hypothetical protein